MKNYEDYVLIGLSGLSVGQTITVPGDEITGAISATGNMVCSLTTDYCRKDRRQQDLVKNQSDTASPYCGCALSWREKVGTYRP